MEFNAISGPNGQLSLGSEYNAKKFRQYLKDNIGMRFLISTLIPESNKQRRFFEGAVIPLLTYYQEEMDHHNTEDRRRVREWILTEFNGEWVMVAGKKIRVKKTSKGKLRDGLLESIIDWMCDNYGADVPKALEPGRYNNWRDVLYGAGDIDNYIDYLVESRIIK